MIDDWLLSLIYAAWLAASTMPLGLMLGSPCSPCCPQGCGVADGKPRTDPKDEGTWVPSGTWRGAGGVTWSFTANPGDDSGETWFFYGSAATSKIGGGASTAEQQDWGNICNWYSNKTTSPSSTSALTTNLDKRASKLPPSDAIVHVYSPLSTALASPQTIKSIYFWGNANFTANSELTLTQAAHDTVSGAFFRQDFNTTNNSGTINGGAFFFNSGLFAARVGNTSSGVVNGGAQFYASSNFGVINDGAEFEGEDSGNGGTVNGGAVFSSSSGNGVLGIVNDGAEFYTDCNNQGVVNDGALFESNAVNFNGGIVNGGATFNDTAKNQGSTVNGGATFNDSASNVVSGTVNGGAVFNDAACSTREVGVFFNPFRPQDPCSRKFVAHPTDLPTCNGTAPDGCANAADTCGCG